MQVGIDLDGIALYQLTGSVEVALTLDALDLCQQTSKERAQGLIVGDAHEGFAFAFLHLDNAPTLFIAPMGYQRTVAHVGLLYLATGFDADELRHQTVHDIAIVLCLVSLIIGQQSQLHELMVGNIIETKEVGTCLLDGIAISLQRIRISTWQQLSTTVSQTFVQVGMQVITHITITFYKREC